MSRILAEVYADADMHQDCPNCQAAPNDYCRRPDGEVRSVPCIARMPSRTADDQSQRHPGTGQVRRTNTPNMEGNA